MEIRLLGVVAIMLVVDASPSCSSSPGLRSGSAGRKSNMLVDAHAGYKVALVTVFSRKLMISTTSRRIANRVTQLNASLRMYTSR